jgi:hypothetical protein
MTKIHERADRPYPEVLLCLGISARRSLGGPFFWPKRKTMRPHTAKEHCRLSSRAYTASALVKEPGIGSVVIDARTASAGRRAAGGSSRNSSPGPSRLLPTAQVGSYANRPDQQVGLGPWLLRSMLADRKPGDFTSGVTKEKIDAEIAKLLAKFAIEQAKSGGVENSTHHRPTPSKETRRGRVPSTDPRCTT